MLSNTLTRRIEWGDCDPAGIVFNPNFFSFFDHGVTMLYEAAGLPKQEMVARYGIAGCPLVATNAQFKAPCRYGDEIEIASSIAEIRKSSFDILHALTKDGALCVEVRETRVWTQKDPETGRLKSTPIPADVVARFRGE
ncbi:MAG: 4-hydroxybenzoyl-CoA thioesterase [Rhizobiaceae bacterium MnEN-MB40S]|nr:MAG: 4-hydroxybenzoyl-CoA thioesterase [Rhizobiaceae bacterium MnEN-MB40S]